MRVYVVHQVQVVDGVPKSVILGAYMDRNMADKVAGGVCEGIVLDLLPPEVQTIVREETKTAPMANILCPCCDGEGRILSFSTNGLRATALDLSFPDFNPQLYHHCPTLYRKVQEKDLGQVHGFNRGWKQIVWDMALELEFYLTRKEDASKPYLKKVTSSKGDLIVDMSKTTPEVNAIIKRAQEKAGHTCEFCGRPDGKKENIKGETWVVCPRC